MEIMRRFSQQLAGQFVGGEPRRLAASSRRRLRSLRPMAEGLEVRSLLSVGLDPSYGFGGIANLNLPSTATSQPTFNADTTALQNGQVVAAGYEYGIGSSSTESLAVARLTTSGALDTTFDSTGIETISTSVVSGYTLDDNPDAIAVQSNGQILVLTTATSTTTSTEDFAIIRLNPNGGLDTAFGNNAGIELFNFGSNWSVDDADAMAIGPDGKIVVVGTVFSSSPSNEQFGIARLTTTGLLDSSFNAGGTLPGTQEVSFGSTTDASPVGVVVNSASGIVVAGNVTPTTSSSSPVSNIGVALLNANGAPGFDTLPSYNTNDDDTASAVTLQGSQIVIAGYSLAQSVPSSSSASPVDELTVTRLNPNGTFDTSFNGSGKYIQSLSVGGIAYSTQANSVIAMPDGTLLVGGNAGPAYTYSSSGMFVSLTANGGLNTNYGSNGVALLSTYVSGPLLLQSDGKIVFLSDGSVARTTAPVPATSPTPVVVTTGTGSKAKVTGITVFFNTAVNPAMASNVKLYKVRIGMKGKNYIKIKRATYNASNNSVTLLFRGASKLNKKGYQVMIAASTGIVAAGAPLLNNGAMYMVYVPPTSTS